MKGLLVVLILAPALASGQTASDDSLEKLRQELAANPNNSLAHYQIGMILMQRQDFQAAAREFGAAVRGNLQAPMLAEALSRLSSILGRLEGSADQRHVPGALFVDDSEITQKTPPDYSEEARIAGLEGKVILLGLVDEDGRMQEPQVVESLGLGLDEKAVVAVRDWRFLLHRDEGRPRKEVRRAQVDFQLPAKQSRWHLIGVEFLQAPGTSRPMFATAKYPLGAGISVRAYEEGRILGAVGRQATAKLTFDVDERGTPVHFDVDNASLDLWGDEAIDLAQQWHFKPGSRNGVPVTAPVSVELAWGPKELSPATIERLRLQESSSTYVQNSVLQGPQILYAEPAEYPDEIRKAGVHGAVIVSCTVDEEGIPRQVHVAKSLDPTLDQNAVDAVSGWRFKPTLLNDQPAAVPATVQVNFGPRKRVSAPR